jgi:hypothetical protein
VLISREHGCTSVKGVTTDAVEGPINGLFGDLMTALESSMMNVTPVT